MRLRRHGLRQLAARSCLVWQLLLIRVSSGSRASHDRLVRPMTPDLLAGVVVVASVGAWAIFMAYLRARPEAAPPVESSLGVLPTGAPVAGSGIAERTPKPRSSTADAASATRRQFLNRAYVAAALVGLSNFALASLDYLWPRDTGGLGGKINLGDADELRARLQARVPITHAETEFLPPGIYLMTYEGQPDAANKIPAYVAANTAASGFCAMYRKCVHLGCTVPFCGSSKWFECPCHGSKYSINGEYRAGPAPRSLDRYRVDIVNGQVVVDTSTLITGPPRGTVTSQPQPEGAHCVTISGA